MNLAWHAVKMQDGEHPGYEASALAGLDQSLEVIAAKKIKVVINGGALRPRALAEKTLEMVGLSFARPS
jgi:hypothetical protein